MRAIYRSPGIDGFVGHRTQAMEFRQSAYRPSLKDGSSCWGFRAGRWRARTARQGLGLEEKRPDT